MMDKVAFITGITGQDGSYLAEELLSQNYRVVGMMRRLSTPNLNRVAAFYSEIEMVEGDVTDLSCLILFLLKYKPTHFFNLAAQSHVATSFTQPKLTWDVTGQGAMNCLEAIRIARLNTRFYQASSSEMYGDSYSLHSKTGCSMSCKYQDEDTKMNPQSPYAIAKLAAYNAVRLYRKSYGMFASNGILFNHESERRGQEFVTQKIATYVARLKLHMEYLESIGYTKNEIERELQHFSRLQLGNLKAYRDWGHAADYVKGMRMILEFERPDDFVLATGETFSVEDFAREAFNFVNCDYNKFIVIDESLKRPSEVPYLRGDYSKAKKLLGWEPTTTFSELVKRMVEHAYSCAARQ